MESLQKEIESLKLSLRRAIACQYNLRTIDVDLEEFESQGETRLPHKRYSSTYENPRTLRLSR